MWVIRLKFRSSLFTMERANFNLDHCRPGSRGTKICTFFWWMPLANCPNFDIDKK